MPQILWIGDEAPIEELSSFRVQRRRSLDFTDDDVDLILLSREAGEGWENLDLLSLRKSRAPFVLEMKGLKESSTRTAFQRYPVVGVYNGVTSSDLKQALKWAAEKADARRDRENILSESSQRNRELERLTEELEKVVSERTAHLAESTTEEKDKLARERHLIRYLSEIALAEGTEEILRALRRELRRFHRIQSLTLVLKDADGSAQLFSAQGDQVVRAEGRSDFESFVLDETTLQQGLANRFARPFNRILRVALETFANGVIAVEHALLSDKERHDIEELLRERSLATGLAVERLALEDRLRRFAIRWERTFDGFRDPVAVIDTDLQVLRGNRSFSAGARRRRCYETFAARTSPCEGCPVAEASRSTETLEGTIQVGRRSYRLRSWPVKEDGSTDVVGRVHHYDDITESRELSLRMLQNEKMSAVGELAGHIAHELNNPLTGIRSLAQVLRSEWTEPPLSEDLDHIENASRRCQDIIRHLLEFSRGGDGQATMVSLDVLTESTLPLLKTSFRRHRQHFVFEAKEAMVLVDPHLVQQVIFNLVNNACQAMKSAGTLKLFTRTVTEDGGEFVELHVGDTGPGISPEIRERLFEPFVTTKKEGEGTGLGLSTSKAIVERFGGRLTVESTPGQGAEFTVRFPLRRLP